MAVVVAPAASADWPTLPSPFPRGMNSAWAVYDRQTGQTFQSGLHYQYRSASLVKLFIALDYLESHGPGYVIPQADLDLLEPMLRSSDDSAASTLWVRDGWEQIVVRSISRMGLVDTEPPVNRGQWGYTAISPADIVTTYRYILDVADPSYRDFIMSNLRQSTTCASDGFNQSFGIPSTVARPWAVKQGWSAWGSTPPPGAGCLAAAQRKALDTPEVRRAVQLAPGEGPVSAPFSAPFSTMAIDPNHPLLHTSGTVGDGDRRIVVVLTIQNTPDWQNGVDKIGLITKNALAVSGFPV
jgi:hypothetical protein